MDFFTIIVVAAVIIAAGVYFYNNSKAKKILAKEDSDAQAPYKVETPLVVTNSNPADNVPVAETAPALAVASQKLKQINQKLPQNLKLLLNQEQKKNQLNLLLLQ